ncbi:hypothetical protein ABR738_14405 [Streptomyces sp. Edi4]|uniref:hypothetical protein n=1 Tax=Streptomyces sp. Edi4 TaxID=3162527 RepID=UPI00330624E9
MSADKRRAAVERLSRLREDEALTAAQVHTVAEGLEVPERTAWRRLAPPKPAAPAVRPRYELSETDRAVLAFYRGKVAAALRARRAVTNGYGTTAGAPVPGFLAESRQPSRPPAPNTASSSPRRAALGSGHGRPVRSRNGDGPDAGRGVEAVTCTHPAVGRQDTCTCRDVQRAARPKVTDPSPPSTDPVSEPRGSLRP